MMLLLAVLVMVIVYLYGLLVEDFKAACAEQAGVQPFRIVVPVFAPGKCVIIEKEIYYPNE